MNKLLIACGLSGMFSLLSLLYWSQLAGPESPAPEDGSPPAPATVYLLEPEKNLGVVGLNEEIHGSFTIVNGTSKSVVLSEPMKSCSCTNAALEKRSLAPGERCSLGYTIKTGSRRVPRVETIGLTCTFDDGEARQFFAKIYFIPKGVFEIEPAEVVLTSERPKFSFVVRADSKAQFHQLLDVRSNHPNVKIDKSCLPAITLELDLETLGEAITNTECTVYTNNLTEPVISIPVRIRK